MIAVRLPALRLNHALGGAVAVLASVAVWPWLVPPVPATRPLTAPRAGAPTPELAALPAITSYAAIVERPLFAPSRRPAPGVSVIGPSVESRYRLIGIVSSGGKRKAFIADGARHSEIAEGDSLDGWMVKEVAQDRVLLTSPLPAGRAR